MIGVGMLGSGFISDTYADALQDVRNAELVANYSRNLERAGGLRRERGVRSRDHTTTSTTLCADPAVDVVVIALPNEVHLEAVRIAAAAGKGDHLHQAAGPHRRRGASRSSTSSTTPASGTATPRARCSRPTSPRPTRWWRPAASATC